MNDEDLEQDDLEGMGEEDGEELVAAAEADDEGDDEGGAADVEDSGSGGGSSAKRKAKEDDLEELPGIEAKQKERDALARAMEEFLARGGKVQEVEPNVVADPAKKPDGKYGSRSI